MKAKEFLRRLRDNSRRIKALNERRNDYYDITLSGVPMQAPHVKKGSQTSPVEASAQRIIDDMTGEIEREIALLAKEIQLAESIILKIPDLRCQDILRYRYLTGWSWDKVAEAMQYNTRWTLRLHGQALQEFEKIAQALDLPLDALIAPEPTVDKEERQP